MKSKYIFLFRAECDPFHNIYTAENSSRKLEISITVTSENFLHSLHYLNTLGTGYLNCLYAYKRKFASPVLNVLKTPLVPVSIPPKLYILHL
jgi:hypothetical protein